ncbi:MAG: hypothetical protein PVJ09_05390 [Candidatus Woesebacteria bacterium]|jgi:hypothetical protein
MPLGSDHFQKVIEYIPQELKAVLKKNDEAAERWYQDPESAGPIIKTTETLSKLLSIATLGVIPDFSKKE